MIGEANVHPIKNGLYLDKATVATRAMPASPNNVCGVLVLTTVRLQHGIKTDIIMKTH